MAAVAEVGSPGSLNAAGMLTPWLAFDPPAMRVAWDCTIGRLSVAVEAAQPEIGAGLLRIRLEA